MPSICTGADATWSHFAVATSAMAPASVCSCSVDPLAAGAVASHRSEAAASHDSDCCRDCCRYRSLQSVGMWSAFGAAKRRHPSGTLRWELVEVFLNILVWSEMVLTQELEFC